MLEKSNVAYESGIEMVAGFDEVRLGEGPLAAS